MKQKRHSISRTIIDDHHPHPEIVLIGQPNCGKSTIFNSVAGYRSISTNFPGATVAYTRSHVAIYGRKCNLVDLPGIYSLTALDRAAEESKKYILDERIDVIINVVDASLLSRSLELTLQLLEINVPMILCLNMMDEAARKGVDIHIDQLAQELKIPVIPTVGSKGQGIDDLFTAAFETIHQSHQKASLSLSRHVEKKINHLEQMLKKKPRRCNHVSDRLIAIKLLEQDPFFAHICDDDMSLAREVSVLQAELSEEHGETPDAVIAAERHNLAMYLFEKVARVSHPKRKWTDHLDDALMHPVLGFVIMLFVLYLFFNLIFKFGSTIETPLMILLMRFVETATMSLGQQSLPYTLLYSALTGIAGGIAIVLPYLLPFLIGLALIEDIGYLPRIAFLMDSFMHKIGLHGTAVIPGILGYGCSVPAVMATRILASPRDRFIASVVAIIIPCSARMVVIMGLVGYYFGGNAALGIYILNIVVVSILGSILSKLMPEDIPGMILEMPSYHRPKAQVVLAKTWLRLKDFIIVAWPLLILGSLILGLAEWQHLDGTINLITRPITYVLDLPPQVGTTLIFGILRKELSMLMLYQALGTENVAAVMTSTQILVFTLFVVFYVPCLATLGIMGRELGWKRTSLATAVTLLLAIVIALLGRIVGAVIF
ncbi:ferrous iron transport protein B [candidate division KSB1 bacterium]|nr:ferrous iron transport protein B [candidate division KSB1 bacterium]RQW04940.1 MAG: ferrous iron transport protein B [candidate division KSB1 bacterium]